MPARVIAEPLGGHGAGTTMKHAHHEFFSGAPRVPTWTLLACSLVVGCGGMDRYNEDKDEPITDPEDAEGAPPTILVEECPTLCEIAETDLAPLNCDVECNIDLGLTYSGNASIDLLFSLLTVEADGEFQNGGSCDVVVECDDVSSCTALALECMDESNNDSGYCMEEYAECDAEQHCQDTHVECTAVAGATLEACLNDPQYTLEDCTNAYNDLLDICQCDYDDCLGAPEDPECGEQPPQAMPLLTAPGQRDVSRRFIHHHLDRVVALDTEIFAMVVPDGTGHARGVRLRSVAPGDAAHALGLRDGDTVLSLNGQPVLGYVDAPATLFPILDQAGTTVVVRRNGANQTLRYRFVP